MVLGDAIVFVYASGVKIATTRCASAAAPAAENPVLLDSAWPLGRVGVMLHQ
jgi:hypothetical protein